MQPMADRPRRPDDPRLGERVEVWDGNAPSLRPGRPVLVGFPQDEGVRRNHGRAGAAAAPAEIRRWLYRLTPFDCATGADLAEVPLLDMGDVRLHGELEPTQEALGEVIAALLAARTVPIVLGGGHETAYGHYLGYVRASLPVAIVNVDAHLDIRPCPDGHGTSGTPFRQALEHSRQPLPGNRYICLGAQPWAVSCDHLQLARQRGCRVFWAFEVDGRLQDYLRREHDRVTGEGASVYFSLDADVVRCSDVPGVSAPNPVGLSADEVATCCRAMGMMPGVTSFDLVEINPTHDRDGQSARWAALAVWHFLAGLSLRRKA